MSIPNYLYSGLGAGLGWLLSRLTLAVSELGSPEVNVPVTFTNTNNPVITVQHKFLKLIINVL